MANRRAKRGEIWDSGILKEHIWGNWTLRLPAMFLNTIFEMLLVQLDNSFSTKLYAHVPCDSPHKNDSLENFNFKKFEI